MVPAARALALAAVVAAAAAAVVGRADTCLCGLSPLVAFCWAPSPAVGQLAGWYRNYSCYCDGQYE